MVLKKFTNIIILCILYLKLVDGENKTRMCSSTECIQVSAVMLERIDGDVDPCDNFYNFACGTFLEMSIPDEYVTVDAFSQMKENIDQQVVSLIEVRPGDSTLDKLVKQLYDACIVRNSQYERGPYEGKSLEELREMIRQLGGWPLASTLPWDSTNWSLEGTIDKMRKLYGQRTDKIFDIASFIIHLQNANNPSIRPVLSLSSHRKAYRVYLLQSAIAIDNYIPAKNNQEIDDVLDFEYKLNQFTRRLQQQSNIMDMASQPKDFLNTLLHLQWLEHFHPSQLHEEIKEIDNIESTVVLDEMRNFLNGTSTRTLANFLIWRLLDYAGSQVSGPLKISKFQLNRGIKGQQDMEQSWKECSNVIENELPYAIGYIYTRNDKSNIRNSTLGMFESIKEEFLKLITSAKWIDEVVREGLLSKLNTLVPLIALPPKGLNEREVKEFYSDVKIDTDQYLRTLLQLRIIDADNKFRQTYATATVDDIDNWKKYLPPTSLSALYSESDNTLRLSYSLSANNIEQEESLKYLNYATTGFIIGHEISHIVNHYINQAANTWPEKFRNELTAKKGCLIEQYSAYQDPDILKNLDGKRTVSENIADLTGMKLTYGAHQRSYRAFEGEHLKLIGNDFTPSQLFWILMAQNWCAVNRNEELTRKILTESYATDRFRVVGMLQNSPDFANDFHCSETSQMNRENKCIIW